MSQVDTSLSLANPHPRNMSTSQKVFLALVGVAITMIFISLFGAAATREATFLWTILGLLTVGGVGYTWETYSHEAAGIKNNGVWFFSESNRGALGWIFGVALTAFYISLYWFPEWLGLNSEGPNTGLIAVFDPLSKMLSGNPASQWFVYGTFYTISILILGVKFIWKYRHSNYHKIRTLSIMFFQTAFAFLIPEFMARLNHQEAIQATGVSVPYYDLKNMWPLNYYNFDGYRIEAMTNDGLNSLTGNLGFIMLVVGISSIFIISPILTYFFGKRWYCSWVCGCGGLAETAGDPFRHLSDKSLKAWRIERWLIHGVLAFAVIMTVAVVFSYLNQHDDAGYWITKEIFTAMVSITLLGLTALLWLRPKLFSTISPNVKVIASIIMVAITGLTIQALFASNGKIFFMEDTYPLRKWYGFFIGAAFSGVVGVGFYPLMGSRVWCRFGCPMAAILGLQQRFFSRFRITTNGGQCISCGNCSTYCEMGIDVRAYAQRGQNIVRASCVGCGVCSAVCPRGVLSLENGPNTGNSRMDDVRY
ncbi:MAG: 4Fe-4S binding protein [Bacteroidia bacterium]|nr:4Fe-4S binding protein [Bacteroidia bacterium]